MIVGLKNDVYMGLSVDCVEVNTMNKNNRVFKVQPNDLNVFLKIDNILSDVMVNRDRLMPVFKLLIAIKNNPKRVKSAFRKVGNSCYLDRSFNYLLDNGYIDTTTKARLIPCFNKHKIDTVYVISKKGERVLKEISNRLFNEK